MQGTCSKQRAAPAQTYLKLYVSDCLSFIASASYCTCKRPLWFCKWSVLRQRLTGGTFLMSQGFYDPCSWQMLRSSFPDVSCFLHHSHENIMDIETWCLQDKNRRHPAVLGGTTVTYLNSNVWRSRSDLEESRRRAEDSSYSFLSGLACIMYFPCI